MDANQYKSDIREFIVSSIANATAFAIERKDSKALLEVASLGGGLISEDAMGRERVPMGFVMNEDEEVLLKEVEQEEEEQDG